MMKCTLSVLLITISLVGFAQDKTPAGHLFIIGGGQRSDVLMQQMIATAKLTSKDYVIVLPMASEQPDTGFLYLSRQLQKMTGATLRQFDYNKHDVTDAKWNDSVMNAKLIYILGGDQSRFMRVVLHTPLYTAIHKAYQKGATIAGTSAGAAVMSKYMITGKQLRDADKYKETFDRLWSGNVQFTEGMGLLDRTIIDQHFLKRSRFNRLISALADKPGYDCVGIDESTAIIVHGNQALVAGESQVLQFSNQATFDTTRNGLLKFKSLNIAAFTAGDRFILKP